MFAELQAAPRFAATHRWGDFLLGEAPPFTSLYDTRGDAVHFDGEGRWQRAKLDGATYLRGFDGAVLERFGGPGGADVRRPPGPVHAQVVAFVERARAGAPVPLSSWTVPQLEAEAARYLTAYRPVGIVPPDRYRSVIIQATQGCAYNGCLFCSLYKGQRHHVLSADELSVHVRAVRELLGSNLAARRGVFLGEANALAAPQPALERALEVLQAELPELASDVASFLDAFDVYRSAAELQALATRGLRRVFLGAESGADETLRLLGKPATAASITQAVVALKEARLSVGLIFLAGLGPAHVAASVELISRLPLEATDVVYVSPLVVPEGGALATALSARGLLGVDADAEASQLRAALAGGHAKVARYDVRRWLYGG